MRLILKNGPERTLLSLPNAIISHWTGFVTCYVRTTLISNVLNIRDSVAFPSPSALISMEGAAQRRGVGYPGVQEAAAAGGSCTREHSAWR